MKFNSLLIFFLLGFFSTSHGQWKRTGGPDGNSIGALLVDGNRVYSGTNGGNGSMDGGLFLATDTSFHWQQIGRTTFGNLKVTALHKVGIVLLAGTDGQGVFRSVDNGVTWIQSNLGLNGFALYPRCFLQQGRFTYLGSSGSGVYQSADSGKTWFSANAGLPSNATCIAMVKAKNKIYLKTENQGQFRSADSAATWLAINNVPTSFLTGYAMAALNDTLYVGSDRFLLKSGDEGNTWRKIINWPFNVQPLTLLPSGSQLLIGTERGGLYHLHNDSLLVRAFDDSGLVAKSISQLAFYNGQLLAGTIKGSGIGSFGQPLGGGIYQFNGTKKVWKQASYGIFPDIHVVGVYAVDNYLFAVPESAFGNNFGLYRSADEGRSWVATRTPVGPYGRVIKQGNSYFTVFGNSGIGRSVNEGLDWSLSMNGAEQSLFNNLISSGNTIFACSYGNGIWRSTNEGISWQSCSIGLPGNAQCYEMGRLGNTLFVGVNGAPNTIYQSTNNGNSWAAVPNTDWGRTEHFLTVGNTVFATSNTAVYKSTNNGATWAVIGHPNLYGYPAGLAATADGKLVVSAGQGFVWSPDNGTTWLVNTEGLGSLTMGPLTIHNGKVFGGAGQSGVLWRSVSELQATEVLPQSMMDNGMSIWPNPARDWVEIRSIGEESENQITVFQSNGQKIWEGKSSHSLQVKNWPKGVYFVRLISLRGAISQKLVVE